MLRYKSALNCAILLSLTACAASYPPLYTSPVSEAKSADTDLERILLAAGQTQARYEAYYRKTAKGLDATQIPLIIAAAGAAGVIYDSPKNSLDILAGIGIGTAAYTATRSILIPARLPELYIMGHSALGCVRGEGPLFAGDVAEAQRRNVQQLRGQLFDDVVAGREVYELTAISPDADPGRRKEFQFAMTTLNNAIIEGARALDIAGQQLAAFDGAATVFGASVTSIHARVATKAREGRTVDFAQLRQDFTAGIEGAGGQQGGQLAAAPATSEPVMDDEDSIRRVRDTSNDIQEARQVLVTATPDYIAALGRVAICPNIVS